MRHRGRDGLAGMSVSLLSDQEAMTVFDFKTKLALQIRGWAGAICRAIWRRVYG
jgi:hypothetical protein